MEQQRDLYRRVAKVNEAVVVVGHGATGEGGVAVLARMQVVGVVMMNEGRSRGSVQTVECFGAVLVIYPVTDRLD